MNYGVFTPEMKQTHTILVPGMLAIHFRLFPPSLRRAATMSKCCTMKEMKWWRKASATYINDTCYPALLVIGQMIAALKSGKYDLNKVALAITQTGGGCRASNYIFLLRKALAMGRMGAYSGAFGQLLWSGERKRRGAGLCRWARSCSMLFLYGDAMMWLRNQVKPYERSAGDTDRLVDQLISELEDKFRRNDYSASKEFYRDIIRRFAAIPRHQQKKIRVGIVGEIYMKYAPLGNHHLEDFLIEEGFEPVLSGVADFGLYCLENAVSIIAIITVMR